jgi:hypothetical protein
MRRIFKAGTISGTSYAMLRALLIPIICGEPACSPGLSQACQKTGTDASDALLCYERASR